MILFQISMSVLPEKQKEVVQTLLSLMPAMGGEPGCLGYTFMSDIADKDLLCVLEEWESREKLEHHLKSDIFGVLLGTRSLLRRPHGIHIYTVQKTEGMSAVLAARGRDNDSDRIRNQGENQ